jgi:hypothetical protein
MTLPSTAESPVSGNTCILNVRVTALGQAATANVKDLLFLVWCGPQLTASVFTTTCSAFVSHFVQVSVERYYCCVELHYVTPVTVAYRLDKTGDSYDLIPLLNVGDYDVSLLF